MSVRMKSFLFFFFNDTATTEIYTLSLHDALPISLRVSRASSVSASGRVFARTRPDTLSGKDLMHSKATYPRSEEHTSELQSRQYLVCRLLLEKKKNNHDTLQVRISLMHVNLRQYS